MEIQRGDTLVLKNGKKVMAYTVYDDDTISTIILDSYESLVVKKEDVSEVIKQSGRKIF